MGPPSVKVQVIPYSYRLVQKTKKKKKKKMGPPETTYS